MARHYTFNSPLPNPVYPSNSAVLPSFYVGAYTDVGILTTAPGFSGTNSEISYLYDGGVKHNQSGDLSEGQYFNLSGNTGDSSDPTNPDVLYMEGENLDHDGIYKTFVVWDEGTVEQAGFIYSSLYGGRYGMPGGGTDQVAAIDVIIVGQNTSGSDTTHTNDTNLVNLSYNNATLGGIAGQAYNTNITIIGGPGRDLFIGGEGSDLIYGGDEHTGLGDGIWGGGGNDTIYGGSDFGNLTGGADDLFGYSGNDLIYGGSDGDVYYGDAGTDTIYGATFGGVSLAPTPGDLQIKVGSITGTNGTFFGGDGNDTLYSSTATLIGGAGTKEFFFGGNPFWNGSQGWVDHGFVQNPDGQDTGTMDVVSYQNAATSVIVDLTTQFFPIWDSNGSPVPLGAAVSTGAGAAANDIFYGIEGIIGGTTGDNLTGNAVANFFSGLGGNDTLTGNAGNDTLWGGITDLAGDGNNTLIGGAGLDSVTGGGGNDLIIGNADVTPGGNTTGWDGVTGSTGIILALGSRYQTQDSIAGGAGTDTFNMSTGGDTTNTTGGYYSGYSAGVQMISGIEIIIASAGADVLNLTNGSNAAVSDSISIFAGNGNDAVFSGSGNDLIVGDSTAGGVGTDTLFGGAGNDLVWGDLQNDITGTTGLGDLLYGGLGNDSLFSGAGDDTVYGGAGNDTIDAGTGNDKIFDSDAVSIMGGDGADIINADFTNTALVGTIVGGLNSGSDLADLVFTTGSYTSVTSSLGLGNDVFIGSASGTGSDIDTVDGQDGNDVLSSWSGNDVLSGGIGNDVAWGGAGNDTIYGGDGTDYLYGGGTTGGGTNVMYGGLGEDYYYVSRADGINQIWDQDRIANANTDPTVNYLVIYGQFDFADTTGSGGQPIDYLLNGAGVLDPDHNLGNNSAGSMVRITNSGDLITLNIISGLGSGTTTVTFDDRDISQIVLWNNDATTGQNVLQFYNVDLVNHTYNFFA